MTVHRLKADFISVVVDTAINQHKATDVCQWLVKEGWITVSPAMVKFFVSGEIQPFGIMIAGAEMWVSACDLPPLG